MTENLTSSTLLIVTDSLDLGLLEHPTDMVSRHSPVLPLLWVERIQQLDTIEACHRLAPAQPPRILVVPGFGHTGIAANPLPTFSFNDQATAGRSRRLY